MANPFLKRPTGANPRAYQVSTPARAGRPTRAGSFSGKVTRSESGGSFFREGMAVTKVDQVTGKSSRVNRSAYNSSIAGVKADRRGNY